MDTLTTTTMIETKVTFSTIMEQQLVLSDNSIATNENMANPEKQSKDNDETEESSHDIANETAVATTFSIDSSNTLLNDIAGVQRLQSNSLTIIAPLEDFVWVRTPEALKEYNIVDHWEYLGRKYLYHSASLQINIPWFLRNKCIAMNTEEKSLPSGEMDAKTKYWNLCYDVRKELWGLMSDSFSRFRCTDKYKSVADNLSKNNQVKRTRRSLIKFAEPNTLKSR